MFYCVFGVNGSYYNRNSPPCIIIEEKISLRWLLSAFQIICRLLITFLAFFFSIERKALQAFGFQRNFMKIYLKRLIYYSIWRHPRGSTIINKTSPSIIERKTFPARSLSVNISTSASYTETFHVISLFWFLFRAKREKFTKVKALINI